MDNFRGFARYKDEVICAWVLIVPLDGPMAADGTMPMELSQLGGSTR